MRYTWLAVLFVSGCAFGSPNNGGDDDDTPAPDAGGGVDAGDDQAVCGDGVREGSELCDGAGCPTTCGDSDACTIDTLTGSAATCTAVCSHAQVTACNSISDGCCPAGCSLALDPDCLPYGIDAYYDPDYDLVDLGPASGVPTPYGCVMVDPNDPNKLLLGGAANGAAGVLYTLPITRDGNGHITGFAGAATTYATAEYNDGGITIGPGGVLFLARWPVNGLGQYKPGSAAPDRVDDMTALGVASSAASVMFVPDTHPGAGTLKLMSWSIGQWYEMTFAPDGNGTFAVSAAAQRATLAGGPEGMAYIPIGSPLVPQPSVVVSEFSAGEVSVYEVDAMGDPVVASRKRLVYGLSGAEGASIDPVSGDFLFSTFGTGTDRVVVVRGFVPPVVD